MNAHHTQFEQLLSLRGRRASEQPISQLMATALANPDIISLAAGFVDNATLPLGSVAQAAASVLEDDSLGRRAMQYGTNNGPLALRQQIARRNFGEPHLDLADRMILTAGSNQLLHLVSECILSEGDIVLCAAPTYFVYLGLLKDMGVRAIGIEADASGMIPESLDNRLRAIEAAGELHRVKAIYLIPYFDNPAGSTIPEPRRRELITLIDSWQRKSPLVLLVDNAYRDLRYEGDDVPTFTQLGSGTDWTIESGTFSKNFAPGIRVGWGTLPEWLVEPAQRLKAVIDFGSAHLNQHLMLRILQSGDFDRQVAGLQRAYAKKLSAMLEACDQHLKGIAGTQYRHPTGGLYVWLELPEGLDASPGSSLWDECVQRGVLYVPGEFCFPTEGAAVRKNSIRLSFGVQSESQIRQGIQILGDSIRAVIAGAVAKA